MHLIKTNRMIDLFWNAQLGSGSQENFTFRDKQFLRDKRKFQCLWCIELAISKLFHFHFALMIES